MRKKRASTSSELRLNTSTPRAGSHTRPARRGVADVVLSGVSGAPCVEGEDVKFVSFEIERDICGPNGEVNLGSLGDGVLGGGVEAATGPIFGEAGLLGGVPNDDLRVGINCCW